MGAIDEWYNSNSLLPKGKRNEHATNSVLKLTGNLLDHCLIMDRANHVIYVKYSFSHTVNETLLVFAVERAELHAQ